jgi:hypothetical protein
VVIPNTAEVKLHWSVTGEGSFTNVLHGLYSTAPTFNPPLAEAIFSAIKTASSTTAFFAHLGTNVRFDAVTVKNLNSPNLAEFRSTSLAMPGTGTPPIASINNALVVTLRTAQAGQGFRGRVYLAGLLQADLASPRQWLNATGLLAVDFVSGIDAAMSAQQIPLAVAQHALNAGTHHDGTPWAARPAGSFDVVSMAIVNDRVDSQRRRLGR